jgi:hypothetical protein
MARAPTSLWTHPGRQDYARDTMKTASAVPFHRTLTRSLVAALGAVLLATSVVTAQESPAPATAAPAAAAPSTAPEVPTTAPEDPEAVTSPASPLQPRRWSLAQMPQRPAGWSLQDVIAGGPGFIAVGGGSQGRARSAPEAIVWLSDARGRAWQAAPLFGDAAEGTMRGITATADGYVAVGDGPDGGAIWRSTDGIGWQRLAHDAVFDSSSIADVADGPAGLIAVGCQGDVDCATSRAWRSTDGGATWVSLETPPPGLARAIAATDSGYLVAGQSSTNADPMLVSSADGQAWQPSQGLPGGPAGLAALGAFGDTLAGGSSTESGAARALLLRSAGGSAWQSVGHRRFRDADIMAIAGGDPGVFLLGSRSQRVDGRLRSRPLALWSADLARFRTTPFPAQSLRAGGEVNAATFSADGSFVVAVGGTARPVPTVWINRLVEPPARGDQSSGQPTESTDQAAESTGEPIDQDITIDESASAAPTATPAS